MGGRERLYPITPSNYRRISISPTSQAALQVKGMERHGCLQASAAGTGWGWSSSQGASLGCRGTHSKPPSQELMQSMDNQGMRWRYSYAAPPLCSLPPGQQEPQLGVLVQQGTKSDAWNSKQGQRPGLLVNVTQLPPLGA